MATALARRPAVVVIVLAMPELPEVETTRRGIEQHVAGRVIRAVIVRRRDLRQPVSDDLESLEGARISAVRRRSKYLLLDTEAGVTLLVHLGMSGSLRIARPAAEWRKHDHIAITFDSGMELRFHDPRRFGLFLTVPGNAAEHPLLAALGPEPFDPAFDAAYLAARCRNRSTAIKLLIMDAKIVVGVGNIYASEALFRAGIRPATPTGRLTKPRLGKLVSAIRIVLAESIAAGGTTLRDFLHSTGEPGYFKQRLHVYDRKGEPCHTCGETIRHAMMGQRSTYWCPKCQK